MLKGGTVIFTLLVFYSQGIPEGDHIGVAVYGVYYGVYYPVYYGVYGGSFWVFMFIVEMNEIRNSTDSILSCLVGTTPSEGVWPMPSEPPEKEGNPSQKA